MAGGKNFAEHHSRIVLCSFAEPLSKRSRVLAVEGLKPPAIDHQEEVIPRFEDPAEAALESEILESLSYWIRFDHVTSGEAA